MKIVFVLLFFINIYAVDLYKNSNILVEFLQGQLPYDTEKYVVNSVHKLNNVLFIKINVKQLNISTKKFKKHKKVIISNMINDIQRQQCMDDELLKLLYKERLTIKYEIYNGGNILFTTTINQRICENIKASLEFLEESS